MLGARPWKEGSRRSERKGRDHDIGPSELLRFARLIRGDQDHMKCATHVPGPVQSYLDGGCDARPGLRETVGVVEDEHEGTTLWR
jgi:hypothetical protein